MPLTVEEINSPEDLRRGREIGAWLRAGLAKKGWRISDLARATNHSESWLGQIYRNCIKSTTLQYQRPSEKILHDVAIALEIDENVGRLAAGYVALPRSPVTPITPTQTLVLREGATVYLFNPGDTPMEITQDLRLLLEMKAEQQKDREKGS